MIFGVHEVIFVYAHRLPAALGTEMTDRFISGNDKKEPVDMVRVPDRRPSLVQLDKCIGNNVFRQFGLADMIPDDEEKPGEMQVVDDLEGIRVALFELLEQQR